MIRKNFFLNVPPYERILRLTKSAKSMGFWDFDWLPWGKDPGQEIVSDSLRMTRDDAYCFDGGTYSSNAKTNEFRLASRACFQIWFTKVRIFDEEGIMVKYFNEGDKKDLRRIKPIDQTKSLNKTLNFLGDLKTIISAKTGPSLSKLHKEIEEVQEEIKWIEKEYRVLFYNTQEAIISTARFAIFKSRFLAVQKKLIELHKKIKSIFEQEHRV